MPIPLSRITSRTSSPDFSVQTWTRGVAPGVTPRVQVWTEKSGEDVRLVIRDNGIGIDAAHQNRLFKMFERVHPNLPYEGTGVGLAIVRKAVSRMGGEVGMSSDGVNGTTFWVRLPAPAEST